MRRLRKGKKKGFCVAFTSIQRKTPSVITSKEALHNDGDNKERGWDEKTRNLQYMVACLSRVFSLVLSW